MNLRPSPLAFVVFLLAGWISRQQLTSIEYLKAENRMLRERFKGRSLRFSDKERALLARKAFGVLLELGAIVTPDTLLRWQRQLIAQKFDFSHRRKPGRPRTMRIIAELIVRMALDNPRWGYTRIQGALYNLGHEVGRGTVANVLKREGHRTGARARRAHALVGVSQGALAQHRGYGLLERRSVVLTRIGDLLRALYH